MNTPTVTIELSVPGWGVTKIEELRGDTEWVGRHRITTGGPSTYRGYWDVGQCGRITTTGYRPGYTGFQTCQNVFVVTEYDGAVER